MQHAAKCSGMHQYMKQSVELAAVDLSPSWWPVSQTDSDGD